MGAVFALFAGFYYWTPKIVGKTYNELLGKIHFWTLFVGVKNEKKYLNRDINFIKSTNKPTNNSCPDWSEEKFKMFFENVKINKKDIYNKLKGKSGVYLFINKINNDLYVGSSIILKKRMASHFYHAISNKDTNIILYRAFRIYNLENFSLAILEFCESNIILCSDLEQKWINYYKPKYNVLKIAGSSSDFRHSIETINNLREKFKTYNHPKYGYKTSDETKLAISTSIKEFYRNQKHHAIGKKGVLSSQYGIGGQFVFCYSKDGKELIFPSINGAKQFFKVRWTSIKKNLDSQNWITLQGKEWILQSKPPRL